MRIGIDVRYLSHGLVGGVHTYMKHFLPPLIELAAEHEIYLYADTKRAFELEQLPAHVVVRYVPWRSSLSSVYNDFFMRRRMAADRLDVVHYPANYGFGPPGTRVVITLHDAINILPLREIVRGHARQPRTIATMSYLHFCTLLALRRVHFVITASTHAMQEIIRRSRIDPQRIRAVPHAPAPDLRRVEDELQRSAVRRHYGLSRPFILADALKNPAVLVHAWRLLPDALRRERQLVFFSRRSDPAQIVQEALAAGEARLLVRPPREDLATLYSMAEAFVFPSWIEGFGLPVLEAMACGAPVIASNRGSIPEVAGNAALLADADDPQAFAAHLRRLLCHPGEVQQLRSLGFARIAQFSWQASAQRILECYLQALN